MLALGSSFWSAKMAACWSSLILEAQAAIQDGEDVVGGEVVGVDGLDDFVLGTCLGVFVLLVKRKPEFTVGVARTREHLGDEAKVGDGAFEIALVTLKESAIVECARVIWRELEGLLEMQTGVVIPLPLNFDDGLVGIGVDVIGTKLGDVRECVDGGGVLLRVQ